MEENKDNVNHPEHYTQSGFECIDAIQALTSGYSDGFGAYSVGQVLKYIWRAPFKGSFMEDLRKAQWYLNHYIHAVVMENEINEYCKTQD